MEVPVKFSLRINETNKIVRKLSDMQECWRDPKVVQEMLDKGNNPVIYEVYSCENNGAGELSYAITLINPGTVGDEYYMTKGHFHVAHSGEVYLTLDGEGVLLLQNLRGESKKLRMRAGEICYVPSGFAHRAVNTGKTRLIFLAIYSSEAGHDYKSIEKEGFKEIILANK